MVRVAEWLKGMGNPRYKNGLKVTIHESELSKLSSFIKNNNNRAQIDVCFNSDLFHEDVPDDFIIDALAVSKHNYWRDSYILLTKRSERLLKINENPRIKDMFNYFRVGVSVETPEQYYRIRHLQQVKCAHRYLSLAPFLAPMPDLPLEGINYVRLVPEGGPKVKPIDPQAIDNVRLQCITAGVRFKQTWFNPEKIFIRDDNIAAGPMEIFPESMIYQLIERTGGLQVIPLPWHPRAGEWIELRKKLRHLSHIKIAEMVRQVAPEFFEG